ncbi:unnamed protein product [Caenorhabditis auriculariae]|uniref:Piwi domain-containing protein n=1 Tax=Caenorhabditis auriculariae TaxID=2777116 RepID=A0A8S1HN21_9PELO|nr:unnamed protein product [Caenorhabditis auriculariae]
MKTASRAGALKGASRSGRGGLGRGRPDLRTALVLGPGGQEGRFSYHTQSLFSLEDTRQKMALEKKMEKLTVGGPLIEFAPKKQPGNAGTQTNLVSNLAKTTIPKNTQFSKYDVNIELGFENTDRVKSLTRGGSKDDTTQQERRMQATAIYKKAVSQNASFFKNATCFYDRQANLYSLEKLECGPEGTTFEFSPRDFEFLSQDVVKVTITFSAVADSFQANTNNLASSCRPRASESDKTLLEAVNLIVSGKALVDENVITYGNCVHYLYNTESVGLPLPPNFTTGDKYIGTGLTKAVKVLEGNPTAAAPVTAYTVCEIKSSAFHLDNEPLMDKFNDLMPPKKSLPINAEPNSPEARQLLRLVKGIAVRVKYGDRKSFILGGFGPVANSSASAFEHNGQRYTVAEYYEKVLKKKLKNPSLFTVYDSKKRNIRYPVEMLYVAENQRATTGQLAHKQQAELVKVAAALPADRLERTRKLKNALGLNSREPMLKDVGIVISDQFEEVPGRILEAPALEYAQKKIVRVEDNNSTWRTNGTRFVQPANLQKWTLYAIETNFNVNEYVKRLIFKAKDKGMNVAQPNIKMISPYRGGLAGLFDQAIKAGSTFIMFISNDNLNLHNEIKLLEQKFQVVTQDIRNSKASLTIEKNQGQTLENVLNKTNKKLGGLNYTLAQGNPKSVIASPERVILGFEMSHAAPHSDQPSVLGWKNETFCAMVQKVILAVAKSRSVKPKHLMIYINGIEQGSYAAILDEVIPALRKACVEAQFRPLMTVMAVNKTHSERLFKEKITGGRGAEQNITPGTIVDKKIVNPQLTEFYLSSQLAIQGTARAAKYTVVYDDHNMSTDAIEGVTHALAFLYGVVSSAISLPAPLYMAGNYSKRGHNNYIAAKLNDNRTVSSDGDHPFVLEDLNNTLTYTGKTLEYVRYNA